MRKAIVAASVFLILIALVILIAWPEMKVTIPVLDQDALQEDKAKWSQDEQGINSITPSGVYAQLIPAEEAKILMDLEHTIILDVRNPDEYNNGHIKGAVLIPLDELSERAPKELPDKWQMILVYCRSGNRSNTAAKMLADMNYMNVFDFGGINDWPYEVVK